LNKKKKQENIKNLKTRGGGKKGAMRVFHPPKRMVETVSGVGENNRFQKKKKRIGTTVTYPVTGPPQRDGCRVGTLVCKMGVRNRKGRGGDVEGKIEVSGVARFAIVPSQGKAVGGVEGGWGGCEEEPGMHLDSG